MHVVVHQHVGMERAAGGKKCLPQKREISAPIFVIKETGKAIVTTLDNVLRNAWNIKSWLACHGFISPPNCVER